MVEPQDTDNAAGAVVDGEFEELSRFELASGYCADRFDPGKNDALARKGDRIRGRMRGGLCKREEVEGQDFYVGIVKSASMIHERSSRVFDGLVWWVSLLLKVSFLNVFFSKVFFFFFPCFKTRARP